MGWDETHAGSREETIQRFRDFFRTVDFGRLAEAAVFEVDLESVKITASVTRAESELLIAPSGALVEAQLSRSGSFSWPGPAWPHLDSDHTSHTSSTVRAFPGRGLPT